MKLAATTGNFFDYTFSTAEAVHLFKGTGFKGHFTFESCNLIRSIHCYPVYRKKWQRDTRLASPPTELVQRTIAFLYEIGKSILSAYDVYEY